MKYDHIIASAAELNSVRFHLACGYYSTTSFLFEYAGFAAVIDCKGELTFYTCAGEIIETIKAKHMNSGRGCYEDVFITTTDEHVIFELPDYSWKDHYPNCDGENDRWTARIIGVNDKIIYSIQK